MAESGFCIAFGELASPDGLLWTLVTVESPVFNFEFQKAFGDGEALELLGGVGDGGAGLAELTKFGIDTLGLNLGSGWGREEIQSPVFSAIGAAIIFGPSNKKNFV